MLCVKCTKYLHVVNDLTVYESKDDVGYCTCMIVLANITIKPNSSYFLLGCIAALHEN